MIFTKRRCAIVSDRNGLAYMVDGVLHRTDGPAIECFNGNRAWFLKGQQVSEEAHKLMAKHKETIIDKTIPKYGTWRWNNETGSWKLE